MWWSKPFRTAGSILSPLVAGSWKQQLLRLILVISLLAGGGFLFAWLGLAPIAASEGHWPVTRWFLHFAMRNAVQIRALTVKQPELEGPALILKGAGHYATGCAPCHGAPGQSRSLVVRNITPEPPFLPSKIEKWTPEQLFWIVKHGVKYTAMPAWPSRKRDDEVWAMVAFLKTLPELSPADYRELTYGSGNMPTGGVNPDHLRPVSEPLGAVIKNCARCHGEKGLGRNLGAFPKLAGQKEAYLLASLRAFASGERHSGIMQPIAAGLDKDIMRELARYYAGMNHADPAKPAEDPDAIGRGEKLASHGEPKKGVPTCRHCHGPVSHPRNPHFPDLAGQYADYLRLQLSLFKTEDRGGTPYHRIMHSVIKTLSDSQLEALSLYYASLGWNSKKQGETRP